MTAQVVDDHDQATGYRAQLLAGTSVNERRIEAAGMPTAVLECGQGPPVVLLHGPGEFAAAYAWLMSELAATNHVVAPDLPGHGESAFDADLDADSVLDWLDGVIDATCEAAPVLVGRVLGGAIAARLAIARGGRVSQLVLVDTLGLAPFQPAPPFGEALERFFCAPGESTFERLMQYCAYDLDVLRSRLGTQWSALAGYSIDRAKATSIEAAKVLMAAFGVSAIDESELARISVPTTLVWGREDMATPLRVGEGASHTFGWPLHVIDDAADDPAFDQPEKFLNVLKGVLTR